MPKGTITLDKISTSLNTKKESCKLNFEGNFLETDHLEVEVSTTIKGSKESIQKLMDELKVNTIGAKLPFYIEMNPQTTLDEHTPKKKAK